MIKNWKPRLCHWGLKRTKISSQRYFCAKDEHYFCDPPFYYVNTPTPPNLLLWPSPSNRHRATISGLWNGFCEPGYFRLLCFPNLRFKSPSKNWSQFEFCQNDEFILNYLISRQFVALKAKIYYKFLKTTAYKHHYAVRKTTVIDFRNGTMRARRYASWFHIIDSILWVSDYLGTYWFKPWSSTMAGFQRRSVLIGYLKRFLILFLLSPLGHGGHDYLSTLRLVM